MARFDMGGLVRIQVARMQAYAKPDKADALERQMLADAEAKGWRITYRQSTISDEMVLTAHPLLRKGGVPRGVTLSKQSSGKPPRICVGFHRGKLPSVRFTLVVTAPECLEEKFHQAINRVSREISLSEAQAELLHDSWPNFYRLYKSSFPDLWPEKTHPAANESFE